MSNYGQSFLISISSYHPFLNPRKYSKKKRMATQIVSRYLFVQKCTNCGTNALLLHESIRCVNTSMSANDQFLLSHVIRVSFNHVALQRIFFVHVILRPFWSTHVSKHFTIYHSTNIC